MKYGTSFCISSLNQSTKSEPEGKRKLEHHLFVIFRLATHPLTVTAETFKEINKPERYEKGFDENTPAFEKLIDSQYEAIKGVPLDRGTILQKKSEDRIFEDLTVISASKDGNNLILMDKNRSFYELPRDKVLEGYNKQQEKQHKAEMKQKRSNRIDVGWER